MRAAEDLFLSQLSCHARGLAGEFLQVPFPIDCRTHWISGRSAFEVCCFYPHGRSKSFTVHYRLLEPRTQFDRTLLQQAYSDFRAHYDLDLLKDVGCKMAISNFAADRMLHELRDQALEFHQRNNSYNIRFFDFRDLEAEECFYFGRVNPPECLNLPRPRPTRGEEFAEYTVTREFPTEIYEQPAPSRELVAQARQRVEQQIYDILIGREDPAFFRDRTRRLMRVEEERTLREERDRRNCTAREQQLNMLQTFNDSYHELLQGVPEHVRRLYWEGAFDPASGLDRTATHIRNRARRGDRYLRDYEHQYIHPEQDSKQNKEAEERGEKLLKENLTTAQLRRYKKHKSFIVQGGTTGNLYEIKYGTQMNVFKLDADGKSAGGICFVPLGNLVPGDVMLSQKIGLELHEEEVLAVANPF